MITTHTNSVSQLIEQEAKWIEVTGEVDCTDLERVRSSVRSRVAQQSDAAELRNKVVQGGAAEWPPKSQESLKTVAIHDLGDNSKAFLCVAETDQLS